MRSLEMTAPWPEEDEDVEVEDMENRKHSNDGRDDLTESSSDEAIGRKRRKHGGNYFHKSVILIIRYINNKLLESAN